MKVARVFPRRTNATPTDSLAFVGGVPLPGMRPEVDAVHVSVAFTYDLPEARRLAREWSVVAPVSIGGPATMDRGEAFTPGMYLAPGYVITSRGCPNRCGFCDAWKREGNAVREYQIHDGYDVLDNNLLACTEGHIRAVFAMLARQPKRAKFTGGLEAARLRPWHVDLLAELKPERLFFAYDEPADYEPLVEAGKMLREAGFVTRKGGIQHRLGCYVLCGRVGDTLDEAETRMRDTLSAGFLPMAMLWRGRNGKRNPGWMAFAKSWARPASVNALSKAPGVDPRQTDI